MKELVDISGKGGTGKTSIVASFAALAEKAVLADCDVDAADLHLICDPKIIKHEKFCGGSRARIMAGHCTACGKCVAICPKHLFKLIDINKPVYVACSSHDKGKQVMQVCKVGCIACGKCEKQCPPGLFKVKDNLAEIDYNNYVDCDDCIKACPTKVIKKRGER